jgi:hypothetical protein
MSEIRAAAKTALHIMIGALHARTPAESHTKEAQSYIDQITLRIRETAEPYFGGLPEEQYVAKVIADARETLVGNPHDA